MEKPTYQDLLKEAEELAKETKRRPLRRLMNIFLIVILVITTSLVGDKLNTIANLEGQDVDLFIFLFAMAFFSLICYLNYLIEIPVKVSKSLLSRCISELLIKREDEYLEEMNNCSDNLLYIRESVPVAEKELIDARENLKEFSAVKKAFSLWY